MGVTLGNGGKGSVLWVVMRSTGEPYLKNAQELEGRGVFPGEGRARGQPCSRN